MQTDCMYLFDDKVRAIEAAPTPTNVTELKSYLGLLTYYGKFVSNLATKLAPLYKLVQHCVPWRWTSAQFKMLHSESQETVSVILSTGSL